MESGELFYCFCPCFFGLPRCRNVHCAPPENDRSLLANHVARTAFRGYTNGMKTAISIPDPVFTATERLAHKMNKSRSEVYSLALAEYVARHAPEHVTEAMDKVCAEVGEEGRQICDLGGTTSFGAQRVVISQGDVWWADLPEPTGSGPGFRRPVVIVQGDA